MARKKPPIHYIYKTTCNVTKRYYIGMHSTTNLEDGYLGSGKRLRYSIRKYGKENFRLEILEFFDSREKLVEREKELVNEALLLDILCMNLKQGGTGGIFTVEHLRRISILGNLKKSEKLKNDTFYREAYLKKISDSRKGEKNPMYGRPSTKSFLGKKHSKESLEKMSSSSKGTGKGELNSQHGTIWITNGIENKKIKKDSSIPEKWFKGRKI